MLSIDLPYLRYDSFNGKKWIFQSKIPLDDLLEKHNAQEIPLHCYSSAAQVFFGQMSQQLLHFQVGLQYAGTAYNHLKGNKLVVKCSIKKMMEFRLMHQNHSNSSSWPKF